MNAYDIWPGRMYVECRHGAMDAMDGYVKLRSLWTVSFRIQALEEEKNRREEKFDDEASQFESSNFGGLCQHLGHVTDLRASWAVGTSWAATFTVPPSRRNNL